MRTIVITLCLTIISLTLGASPVFRVTKTVRQSDGTVLVVTRTGGDHLLYYVTEDDMPVFPDAKGDYCYAEFNSEGNVAAGTVIAHEADRRTPMEQRVADKHKEAFFTYVQMRHKARYGVGTLSQASVKSMGEVHVPVLLAEFADVAFQPENDIARFDRHLNAENYTDEGGSGSVRDYFIAQSYGKFRPYFDVLGKVKVSKVRAEYGGNSGGDDRNPTGYVAEAIDSAIAHGIDFTPFKNSKGEIMVTVIYPGHGEQVSGNAEEIWAAYYWTMSHTNEATNLQFKTCFVMDELADYGEGEQFDGIGTFCHEFSHALGLPDFYNTNNTRGIFGMDVWSLMDYGQFNNLSRTPVGYSAYEREFFGWLKIDTLKNEKQLVTLPPLHTDSAHKAYRILNEADRTGNEYYILENREESDWYMRLYGEGMLITHVDYLRSAWTNNNINNNRTHQRMTIIPADGVLTPIASKSSAYKGDLWPGYTNNMELSSTTTPCDTAYTGNYMNIRLANIHRDGLNNIVFYYQCSGQLGRVRNAQITAREETGFTAQWQEVAEAESYELKLYKDDVMLRTDTVAEPRITYTDLGAKTTYVIEIVAMADDYIYSPILTVSAGTSGSVPGDVDGDGNVNSADVVAIYNYVISGSASGISKVNADVNGDGQVNSGDVVSVYNIIINGK